MPVKVYKESRVLRGTWAVSDSAPGPWRWKHREESSLVPRVAVKQ
jgi:hypothetical protein